MTTPNPPFRPRAGVWLLWAAGALTSCGAQDAEAPKDASIAEHFVELQEEEAGFDDRSSDAYAEGAPAPMPKRRGAPAPAPASEPAPAAPSDGAAADAAPPTRAWFPETFLWQPALSTDAAGQAQVEVRVPDRLTEWRVLGLAHSPQGGVAGAATSFVSTLPVYADPVLPPFLLQGDVARVPVQVVNTTDVAQRATLTVAASGAATARTTGPVSLPPGGSAVVWTELRPTRSGRLTLRAELGAADAVERTLDVLPSGHPLIQSRSGTLAAARSMELLGPVDLDPDSARVRLVVTPGALAILRQELGSAADRGGLEGAAHALALAGQAPAVLENLGQPVSATGPDPEARRIAENLRSMRIRGAARAARLSRAPGLQVALSLAAPALQHPDDPLLSNLGARLVGQLAEMQRPDGTFGGASGRGWTAQRMIATTAEAVRVMQAAAAAPGTRAEQARRAMLADRVRLRASAAVERSAGRITDPYTAALVLDAGLASGALEPDLEGLVLAGISSLADGRRVLAPGAGVARPDGQTPTTLEATALAALALRDRGHDAAVADLGAAVLAGWSHAAGWGDGRTDRVALQAVVALFADPLPESVTVTLRRDGAPVEVQTLDAAQLRDLVILDRPAGDAAGLHTWAVSAEPAVPGLGFQLALQSWVPWPEQRPQGGLELDVTVPSDLALGRTSELVVTAAAPAGAPLTLEQGLPAGVQVDEQALEALQRSGEVQGFAVEDGRVTLEWTAGAAGQPTRLVLPVTPTLPGRLGAGPTTLALAGQDSVAVVQPPVRWTIRD